MQPLKRIKQQAKENPKRVVLCEGDDPRILQAAVHAARDGIADIILVGNRYKIEKMAAASTIELGEIKIIDPKKSPLITDFANVLFALRQSKGMTVAQATEEVRDPLCFAYMLVRQGYVDGSVAGASHTTGEVVRKAIQIIGVKPGIKMVSSFFLMLFCKSHHKTRGGYIFSDCGLVIDPDSEQLADIALSSADSAKALLGEEPRLAMLSFSTSGSARHKKIDKVVNAARIVTQKRPGLAIDEDIQVDAALVPEISQKKMPASRVKGRANVLIFPNLEAGNIGYKLAERIGGAVAIGPLLQGLAKPANDLSRGCSAEDVYYAIAVTVVQAQAIESAKG